MVSYNALNTIRKHTELFKKDLAMFEKDFEVF